MHVTETLVQTSRQMSNTDKKTSGEELTVWGAVGPNGHVVKSSIGIFKAVANRWALRRGNYEVVKLGTIKSPAVETRAEASRNEQEPVGEEKQQEAQPQRRHREVRGPGQRKRGRPSKADLAARAAAAEAAEREKFS